MRPLCSVVPMWPDLTISFEMRATLDLYCCLSHVPGLCVCMYVGSVCLCTTMPSHWSPARHPTHDSTPWASLCAMLTSGGITRSHHEHNKNAYDKTFHTMFNPWSATCWLLSSILFCFSTSAWNHDWWLVYRCAEKIWAHRFMQWTTTEQEKAVLSSYLMHMCLSNNLGTRCSVAMRETIAGLYMTKDPSVARCLPTDVSGTARA